MIKALHMDDRLIHGQVAISWTRSLSIDLLLIVGDAINSNEMRKASLRLGIPSGIKFGFRSTKEGIAFLQDPKNKNKYNIMVLVDNPKDAYEVGKAVDDIKKLSIGGLRKEAPLVYDNLNLTPEDVDDLLAFIDLGKTVGMQPTPSNQFIDLNERLKAAK